MALPCARRRLSIVSPSPGHALGGGNMSSHTANAAYGKCPLQELSWYVSQSSASPQRQTNKMPSSKQGRRGRGLTMGSVYTFSFFF